MSFFSERDYVSPRRSRVYQETQRIWALMVYGSVDDIQRILSTIGDRFTTDEKIDLLADLWQETVFCGTPSLWSPALFKSILWLSAQYTRNISLVVFYCIAASMANFSDPYSQDSLFTIRQVLPFLLAQTAMRSQHTQEMHRTIGGAMYDTASPLYALPHNPYITQLWLEAIRDKTPKADRDAQFPRAAQIDALWDEIVTAYEAPTQIAQATGMDASMIELTSQYIEYRIPSTFSDGPRPAAAAAATQMHED